MSAIATEMPCDKPSPKLLYNKGLFVAWVFLSIWASADLDLAVAACWIQICSVCLSAILDQLEAYSSYGAKHRALKGQVKQHEYIKASFPVRHLSDH